MSASKAVALSWMLLAQYLGLLTLKLAVAQLDTDAVATTFLDLLHSRDAESGDEGT